jgi:hypothetical protein
LEIKVAYTTPKNVLKQWRNTLSSSQQTLHLRFS